MERMIERFLRYVQVPTASNSGCPDCPSSPEQKVLGAMLVEEMKQIGIADAAMDELGYVYGTIPATPGYEDKPALGLIAHME